MIFTTETQRTLRNTEVFYKAKKTTKTLRTLRHTDFL